MADFGQRQHTTCVCASVQALPLPTIALFVDTATQWEIEVRATQCFSTSRPENQSWSSTSSEYSVIAMGLVHVHRTVFILASLRCFASGSLLPFPVLLPSPSTISSSSSGELESSPQNISVSTPGFQTNLTFLDAGIINVARIKPVCNGTMFGRNLRTNSCWDAIKLLATDTTAITFGDRGLGLNIQLPRRYSSCK